MMVMRYPERPIDPPERGHFSECEDQDCDADCICDDIEQGLIEDAADRQLDAIRSRGW